MNRSIRIVGFQYGEPSACVRMEEIRLPALSAHQVMVNMEYTPVNPADLLRLRGEALHAPLPFVCGGEGVGRVSSVGSAVKRCAPGDRVILPFGNTWATQVLCREDQAFKVDDNIAVEQVSMIGINYLSAMLLAEEGEVQPDDWVVLNAANSAVARLIIQVLASKGIRTLCLVRRENARADVLEAGATEVVVQGTAPSDTFTMARKNGRVTLGLDAIAGTASAEMIELLSDKSTLVIYGLLSGRNIELPTARLVFGNTLVKGFSRMRSLMALPFDKVNHYLDFISENIRSGRWQVEIEKIYPFGQVAQALEHTEKDARGGKILLHWQESL